MADYLLPFSSELTIIEKQEIFAIRNRMINIPVNYSSNKEIHKCECGQIEEMSHIYECKNLNSEKSNLKYEYIYTDNIEHIKKVYRRFTTNMQVRGNNLNNRKNNETSHVTIGPLFPVQCNV